MSKFWLRVNKTDSYWLWMGGLNKCGYAEFHVSKARGKVLAHRHAYELLVGPIPTGLEIDHLCRVRSCVNPAHLEPVTHAENVRRSWPATKAYCSNGHLYDEANTYWRPSGGRDCRVCIRERVRRSKQKRRAA